MVRRFSLTSQIQKLDSTYNECNSSLGENRRPIVSEGQPPLRSFDIEEKGSCDDTVIVRQDHPVPPSVPKSNITDASHDSVENLQDQAVTGSPHECVAKKQSHEMPLSDETLKKHRLPAFFQNNALEPTAGHFTAIPNAMLRQQTMFESVYDFAVYLCMVSKSYGYKRNTCDMGINELVSSTGLSRNSVKKSLDRLLAGKWIKLLQEYEYGRTARKWRVYCPYENGKTDDQTFVVAEKKNGSQGDRVISRSCQEMPPKGSSQDPVTGAPRGTYKESIQIKIQKKSLSEISENTQKYFSNLKSQGKRESEWNAFRKLKADYPEQDISDCIEYLQKHGLSSGELCHSPMAFLEKAIDQVLVKVQAAREREQSRNRVNAAVLTTRRQLEEEAEQRSIKWKMG